MTDFRIFVISEIKQLCFKSCNIKTFCYSDLKREISKSINYHCEHFNKTEKQQFKTELLNGFFSEANFKLRIENDIKLKEELKR